ncbi:MAG TPA: GIY-YIG nuclease family protein [Gammaproteobacteria bacterium]|nr:GIY-YIG nuclease family protein [Gammaproteobacteria bacterium]
MLANCTTYQLFIRLAHRADVTVGRRGQCRFPDGWYIYTGSARRGLRARLRRHCAPPTEKRLRWHIDYLLAQPQAEIRFIAVSEQPECALNRTVDGTMPCPGFGASDCRSACGSHLRFLGETDPLA